MRIRFLFVPHASTTPQLTHLHPQQARSEQSLQRLLDAAQGIIEERGHQELSIAEVVRRAGSSVGGFYARFRNKDELLSALETAFLHRLALLLDEMAAPERWSGASDAEIIRALVTLVVDTHRRHGNLMLAFVARAVRDPEHHGELIAFRRRITERLATLALSRREHVVHPDPALAAEFAVQAVFGILQSRVVSGVLGVHERPIADDVLARELERLVLSYFGIHGDAA